MSRPDARRVIASMSSRRIWVFAVFQEIGISVRKLQSPININLSISALIVVSSPFPTISVRTKPFGFIDLRPESSLRIVVELLNG